MVCLLFLPREARPAVPRFDVVHLDNRPRLHSPRASRRAVSALAILLRRFEECIVAVGDSSSIIVSVEYAEQMMDRGHR